MFKKIIKKIKYFLLTFKYRYLIKIMAIKYFEQKYSELNNRISQFNKDDISNFQKNIDAEYDTFKINLSLEKTFTISNPNAIPYTQKDIPFLEEPIKPKGVVEIYTFEYKISDGFFEIKKFYNQIELLNNGKRITLSLNNHINIRYENWECIKDLNPIAQHYLDELTAIINEVVRDVNDRDYFNRFCINFINKRLFSLK